MNASLAIGVAAATFAAVLGAGWQLVSRLGVTTTLGPLDIALLRYLIPACVLLPVWWRAGLRPAGVAPATLVALVLSGGLPFGLLVLAVRRLGSARAALSASAVPPMTAVGEVVFLGVPGQATVMAAAGLVAAGVVLASGALAWRRAATT